VATEAVIFDFYGTLAVSVQADLHRANADRVAAALGVTGEAYYRVLTTTFEERATGSCGDLTQTLQWMAARCGHSPSAAQLVDACELRRSIEAAYARTLREDAEAALSALQVKGVRVGLVSDCTHELPEVWPTLPIAQYVDATVFSVEAGVRKPHRSLYEAVCSALDVAPGGCLYIGDGGSGELTGAEAVGMTAYQLLSNDVADAVVYDAEAAWSGGRIRALTEVLTLIT
jgi:putative hydrolase of the HAD superfamily